MNAHYEIHELKLLSVKTRYALGMIGELYAKKIIKLSGYKVVESSRNNGDLLVIDSDTGEALKIEVKTARRGKDRKWRFTLWKKNCTDHKNSDIVLLLAVTKSGQFVPFVIPVTAISDKSHACITSHPTSYAGKLARYRVNDARRVGRKCWEYIQ